MFGDRGVAEDAGEDMIKLDIEPEKKNDIKVIEDIITRLKLYEEDTEMLTKQYTEILLDDNVIDILTKISHSEVFARQMPEFYTKNENEENVINCQQNSSYHRFGVFKHILYTIEIVGKDNRQLSSHETKLLKWTMLLHDIGKPYVKTINPDGSDSFSGHDDKSVEISEKVLDRFSFDDIDKKTILTLIKYHDRYLNDGELTFDNLSFLAKELDNKKDLFYLLIEVKIADSKAKSIDVNNRFMTIIPKYYEFANRYFSNVEMTEEEYESKKSEEINLADITNVKEIVNPDTDAGNDESDEAPILEEVIGKKFQDIDDTDFDRIYEGALKKKTIYAVYQTIVDLSTNKIHAYESFNRVKYSKNVNIVDVIKKAKELDKYDKLEQMMFVNSLELFAEAKFKYSNKIFTSIDITSYIKYVNKPRIYDFMAKNNVVVEFDNYTNMNTVDLQKTIKGVKEGGGMVLLNHFDDKSFSFQELNNLDIDYIKYDLRLLKGFEDDEKNQKFLMELSTYCLSRNIRLVVIGIETFEQLNIVKGMGINYVQGFLFSTPSVEIETSNAKINEILSRLDDESIV